MSSAAVQSIGYLSEGDASAGLAPLIDPLSLSINARAGLHSLRCGARSSQFLFYVSFCAYFFVAFSTPRTPLVASYRIQVHIPTLLKMIMDCYDERQYSCCLDIMTTAVEVYGGEAEAVEHFRALLARASARTFATVQVTLCRRA